MLPTCNGNDCTAAGTYINDDGRTLKITEKQNKYGFSLTYTKGASPLTIVINIDLQSSATYYNDSIINPNDALGSVQIYNANSLGLDDTAVPNGFTSSFMFVDDTKI